MNDPIISPWLIYLISLSNSLFAASVFTVFASATFGVIFLLEYDVHKYDEIGKTYARSLKGCAIAFCVAGFVGTFVPSASTIYKMIAASYITPANIQATGELADKAVDKVIDKIADAIQKFERSEKK